MGFTRHEHVDHAGIIDGVSIELVDYAIGDTGEYLMGFVQPVDKGAYYNFDVKISSEACLNMASCYQTIGHELRHTSLANWDLPSPIGSSYQYASNYGQSPGGNYENDAEYYGKWLAKKYGY